MNDPVAEALGRALRQHAEDAPVDDGLLTGVRAGVRRRRRRRTTAAAVAVLAATAVPASVWLTSSTPRETIPMAAPAPPAESAWTTVSYRGVEVRVPAGWHVAIEPGCRPRERAPKVTATKASCEREQDFVSLRSASMVALDSRVAAPTSSDEESASYNRFDLQLRSAGGVLTKGLVLNGVQISAYSTDVDQLERVLKQVRRAPR